MKVSLNWLKDYVGLKGTVESLSNLLTMAGLNVEKVHDVDGDSVFELEITTNRPDWLSHIGVAREIHAVSGSPFRLPPSIIKRNRDSTKPIKVSILDRDLCPYYSAVILEDIEWQNTPEFMKKRLNACGIRPINLIVDITNYVLLEWGQPLHAFDLDLIQGDDIQARSANEGERITAIDGITYELKKMDIVISDTKGPIAMGGVMGGKASEVSTSTKNILLESAFFRPSQVRQTARRLGLGSESSYRFERRVDPKGVEQARERAVYLISKYTKPKRISSVFSSGKLPIIQKKVTLPNTEIKRILGIEISKTLVKSFLKRLGLEVIEKRNLFVAQVPSFRSDLSRPIDLIEEVARLYGYHKIPETLPKLIPTDIQVNPLLDLEQKCRTLSVGLGFQEVITFSIIDDAIVRPLRLAEKSVRLRNPQNKELCVMRPTLLAGLAQSIKRNLSVGQTDLWLFEIGNRYLIHDPQLSPSDGLPHEERMIGFAISSEGTFGWVDKKRPVSFYDVKGVISSILERLNVSCFESTPCESHSFFDDGGAVLIRVNGQTIGFYGMLSDPVRSLFDLQKPVYYGELSLEKLVSLDLKAAQFEEFPRYPISPRDLTVIVSENLKAEAIISHIRQKAGPLAARIDVFDFFKGGQIPKDKKSLSFRIDYQAKDRTLQNEEVNKLHFEIVDSLHRSLGAELPKAKTV